MTRLSNLLRRHKLLTAFMTLTIALIAALAIRTAVTAPTSSGVRVTDCLETEGGTCIRFPSVIGTSLVGTEFVLPEDFAGELNLIVMPFDEEQTRRAEPWLPLALALAEDYPQFAYYDLPTLKSFAPLMRGVITGGMSLIITDPALREVTIMLFLEEKQRFLDALAVENIDAAQIFLLNASGDVVWRYQGEYSDGAGAAMRAAVEDALMP